MTSIAAVIEKVAENLDKFMQTNEIQQPEAGRGRFSARMPRIGVSSRAANTD
jgi:hypothetical protein